MRDQKQSAPAEAKARLLSLVWAGTVVANAPSLCLPILDGYSTKRLAMDGGAVLAGVTEVYTNWCNIRLIAKTSFQVRQSPSSKDQTRESVHYGYILKSFWCARAHDVDVPRNRARERQRHLHFRLIELLPPRFEIAPGQNVFAGRFSYVKKTPFCSFPSTETRFRAGLGASDSKWKPG